MPQNLTNDDSTLLQVMACIREWTWWRHQMETFSALLDICAGNSPVPGEFPAQRPVTRSFDDFFDLSLDKRLGKQSWVWWFETLSSVTLWCHCNGIIVFMICRLTGILKHCYQSNDENLYWYYMCVYLWVVLGYFMMTSSNGNIFHVTSPLCGEFTGPGEFPTHTPVTRSFDVFFHLSLNKRLTQPWGWWFETPSWSFWRQCNVPSGSCYCQYLTKSVLTHWGRVTHIWGSRFAIIGSDNGLSPGRRQSIIWTYAGILLIGPPSNKLQWNLAKASFKKMHLKVSCGN